MKKRITLPPPALPDLEVLKAEREERQAFDQKSAAAYTVKLDGLTYKIGLHGKPYYLHGGQWIKSTKPAETVLKALKEGKTKCK